MAGSRANGSKQEAFVSPEYQQIVDDARLVIRYGMNSGRLPEAGAMANAVAAIENIPAHYCPVNH